MSNEHCANGKMGVLANFAAFRTLEALKIPRSLSRNDKQPPRVCHRSTFLSDIFSLVSKDIDICIKPPASIKPVVMAVQT